MEDAEQYQYMYTPGRKGILPPDPGDVPMVSSGRMSATSGNLPTQQQTQWARKPAGYYRELSLKQITEAMASGGSSRSSIGGKSGQPPLISRELGGSYGGSREFRAKSQDRTSRFGPSTDHRRKQTLAVETALPPRQQS